MVVLEAEGDLRLHHAGVADGQHLHVLRVPSLSVSLSCLSTVEGAKEVGLLTDDIPLLDNLVLPHGLLPVGEHNPAEYSIQYGYNYRDFDQTHLRQQKSSEYY